MNKIDIRIHRVDYSELVENAHKIETWGKKYAIFSLRGFIAEIYVDRISCFDKTIILTLNTRHKNYFQAIDSITYVLNHDDYSIEKLKKIIDNKMRQRYEEAYLYEEARKRSDKKSDEYNALYYTLREKYYDYIVDKISELPSIISNNIDEDDIVDEVISNHIYIEDGYTSAELRKLKGVYPQILEEFDKVSAAIDTIEFQEISNDELLEKVIEELEEDTDVNDIENLTDYVDIDELVSEIEEME